jgi:segregation and condensation protein A
MLLPQYNEEGEVVETEDPRKELVQKLLEYQKYQEVAKKLYERPLLNRDVFARGSREAIENDDPGAIIIEEDGLFSLISAYRRSIKKAHRHVHNVRSKVQSIAARVMEIKERLVVGSRVLLRDLLAVGSAPARAQLLVTFLSLLELGRMGYVSLFQNEAYGDIHIDTKRAIERNVLERVQEFEATDVEAIANSIIAEAAEDRIDIEEAEGEDAVLAQPASPQMSLEESLQKASEDAAAAIAAANNTDIATDEEILAAEMELGEPGEGPIADVNVEAMSEQMAAIETQLAAMEPLAFTMDAAAPAMESMDEFITSDVPVEMIASDEDIAAAPIEEIAAMPVEEIATDEDILVAEAELVAIEASPEAPAEEDAAKVNVADAAAEAAKAFSDFDDSEPGKGDLQI